MIVRAVCDSVQGLLCVLGQGEREGREVGRDRLVKEK